MTQAAGTSRLLSVAILAATLFTVESWVLGPYSWMYAYGAGLETIPTHLALLHGERLFSAWAPFVAGGVDRFSFWGNADPLNLEVVFLALLPVWLGNGLHRFVQYFIAVFFTAKVCEEQLGCEPWQAALAGVLYACFSYFTFGEMLALPALPLFLWLMQRIGASARGWWLPLVAGLGFSTLTTFTHSVPYFAVFAVLWSVMVLRDTSLRAATNLGLMLLGLALGDSPQLLAALANAPLSHREGYPPERVDWSIDGLIYRQLRFDYFNQDPLAKAIAWTLPLPLLTAGAILAALAQAQQPAGTKGATYLRLYALYMLLSQRWLFVTAQNVIAEWLPWVRGVFMGRFFDLPASLLIACQLTLLIGLVRDRLGPARWSNRALTVGVAVLVAFMLIRPKYFLLYRLGVDGWGQMNYEVRSLEQLAQRERDPFRVASVLPLQPAYAYAQGFETADGWANLYPRFYREYWLRVLAPLFRNNPAAKDIFDPDFGRPQDHYIFLGADLMHPSVGALPGDDHKRALLEGFDVDRRFDLKLLALFNVKYLLSEFPLKGRGLELVHAPSNAPSRAYSRDWATGLLSPPSGPRGRTLADRIRNAWSDLHESWRLRSQGKDVFIYRVVDVVPRFRLVEALAVESSGSAVLDRLSSMDAAAMSSTAVLEARDADGISERTGLGRGRVALGAYQPGRIELDVTVSGNGFLVIGNSWNPFWTATVDGSNEKLIRTNHAQYGLSLRDGAHKVVLAYRPPYVMGR